jgi:hypothetical protein
MFSLEIEVIIKNRTFKSMFSYKTIQTRNNTLFIMFRPTTMIFHHLSYYNGITIYDIVSNLSFNPSKYL